MKRFDAHVCTDCEIPHVDNCPNCFGWGIHKGWTTPIAAEDVDRLISQSLTDMAYDAIVEKIKITERKNK